VPPPNGSASYYPVLNNCDPSGKPKVYQACASVKVYKSSSGPTYSFYANDVSSVTGTGSSNARNALNAAGDLPRKVNAADDHLVTGNYLNYLLGTCARGGACTKSKMLIAKEVVNGLLDSVQGVRFGVMTFDYDSVGNGLGARVADTNGDGTGSKATVGASVSTLQNSVNALQPTGNTPLGDPLYDIGLYYKGQTINHSSLGGLTQSFSSPIQLACQPNFVIFVTDGMQTAGTRQMPAEATLRYTTDHASWLPDVPNIQNVIVHTVGFG